MITRSVENPPIIERYAGYAHQRDVLEKTWKLPHYAIFWEMGLGKSKLIIETAAKLYLAGEIDGVLILAPKGGYLCWVCEEIEKHLPAGIKYRVGVYSAGAGNAARRENAVVLRAIDDCLDFAIVNIESVATIQGFQYAGQFAQAHYTLCVVDESIFIKSPNAQRTKAAIRIGRMCDYRRILSGAPMTQGPLDLFTQLEFLSPGLSGHRSFSSFRGMYAQSVQMSYGNRTFQKIVGYKNQAELTKHLLGFSDRRLKSDCLDLPAKIFETVFVEWTTEQRQAYTALKDQAILELDQGLVTTTSALTTLMRLHQINCGHVPTDAGTIMQVPHNRIKVLLDLIESISGKIIIWARFREDIRQIVAALREAYGLESVVSYYGETTQLERFENMERFRNSIECRFFVANAASAGRGLTLIEASTAVYYSMSYSLEEFLQSQDRNHRIGQKEKVTYLTLCVPKTVDEKLIKALQAKKEISATILDNYRELLG
jgi:SNF2 family DNA or RNA helicase